MVMGYLSLDINYYLNVMSTKESNQIHIKTVLLSVTLSQICYAGPTPRRAGALQAEFRGGLSQISLQPFAHSLHTSDVGLLQRVSGFYGFMVFIKTLCLSSPGLGYVRGRPLEK